VCRLLNQDVNSLLSYGFVMYILVGDKGSQKYICFVAKGSTEGEFFSLLDVNCVRKCCFINEKNLYSFLSDVTISCKSKAK
jgi:hypothetical protein